MLDNTNDKIKKQVFIEAFKKLQLSKSINEILEDFAICHLELGEFELKIIELEEELNKKKQVEVETIKVIKEVEEEKMYTMDGFAKLADVNYHTVRQWILRNKIKETLVNGKKFIGINQLTALDEMKTNKEKCYNDIVADINKGISIKNACYSRNVTRGWFERIRNKRK